MPSLLVRSLVVFASTLALSCDDKTGSSASPEVAVVPSGPRGIAPAARQPPPPPPKAARTLSAALSAALSGATLVPISVDAATRRKLCGDPKAALSELRIVPQGPDGSLSNVSEPWAGIRIFGVRPGGTAANLGLVNGDVVVAVDDTPMDSPASEAVALDRMCKAAAVTVHVGGRKGDASVIDLFWSVEGGDAG